VRRPNPATMGVLAAGAVAGALAERRLVRRTVRPRTPAAALATLEGTREERVTAGDGVELAVREAGPAQAALTVVFVHGYTVTAECWAAQVRELAGRSRSAGVRMVLFDQRGHGVSGVGRAENNTIEQLGRDLAEVLRQRVPDGRVVLAGHSMGAMTIMALAEQHPELFGDRIVAAALIDTSSGGMAQVTLGLPAALAAVPGRVMPYGSRAARFNRRAERFRAVDSDLGRWINARVAFGPGVTGPVQDAMARMQAPMRLETMATFLPTFVTHDRTGALAPLKGIPTLIMVGDHDALTPPSHSQVMADALPDAQLVVVPGSGHMLMMEVPDAVTERLRELTARVL
jgi:pimeloyl-ACP methyl ester carboxylesterase